MRCGRPLRWRISTPPSSQDDGCVASVISNNLNVIMKVLTSLTILLTLPNIIFGFYGMNVANLPLDHFWWFPLVIAGVAIVVVGIVLKMKDLF